MTFEQAQDAVKVGHFTRKGGEVRGVIHVGANDGEEIEGYLGLGAEYVLLFEPLVSAQRKLLNRWGHDPRILLMPFALGSENGGRYLSVAEGDGKGSTFLYEPDSQHHFVDKQWAEMRRFDVLPFTTSRDFDTLVVDVQGMELDVLKGFGDRLRFLDHLNIECSRVPQYFGEAPAQEVIDFLSNVGFQQDSPIEDHNDIMFVNRRLGWPMLF